MKLSVAMIVKNESEIIKKCLELVKEADEIIVVDTGSTDNTVELVKSFPHDNIKVFTDYKWEDHFAKARNHAMSKCTGDWIFFIDADDLLEKEGIKKMRDLITKHPEEYCFNIVFKALKGSSYHRIPYLHKNCKEVFWKGAAHNYLSIPANITSDIVVEYSYSPSHTGDPNRTLRILKKEVEADRTKPREMFYLSREYQYRRDWITALYWSNEYLKIANWSPEIADAQLRKARCLWQLQRGEEARDACLQAIKYNANFKEALLFMAEITGPLNRDAWLFMAEIADNSNVLFVRCKTEKDAAYYMSVNDTEPRYTHLYEEVGKIIGDQSMLDIGCGQGKLAEHIQNYDGFDMVKNPYRVADIYSHDYGDYDVYVLLEVLEHLTKDIDILKKIPVGKKTVFSVPSFDCPSHVRRFTEKIIRWRYREVIKLESVTRFNFDNSVRKWKKDFPVTPSYILLCEGWRI